MKMFLKRFFVEFYCNVDVGVNIFSCECVRRRKKSSKMRMPCKPSLRKHRRKSTQQRLLAATMHRGCCGGCNVKCGWLTLVCQHPNSIYFCFFCFKFILFDFINVCVIRKYDHKKPFEYNP